MTRYRLDEAARSDLDSIYDYVAQQSPAAADRLIDLFRAKFEFLSKQPLGGEVRGELSTNLRAFTAGRYVIFYRPAEDGIEVARIIHSARDLDAILGEDQP